MAVRFLTFRAPSHPNGAGQGTEPGTPQDHESTGPGGTQERGAQGQGSTGKGGTGPGEHRKEEEYDAGGGLGEGALGAPHMKPQRDDDPTVT